MSHLYRKLYRGLLKSILLHDSKNASPLQRNPASRGSSAEPSKHLAQSLAASPYSYGSDTEPVRDNLLEGP